MKMLFSKKISIAIFSCTLLSFAQYGLANDSTAIGYWQTVDDVTNQPRSIVKLCQLKNNLLYGRIIQVNYTTEEKPTDACDLCVTTDPRYHQPILGSIFLTDMQKYGNNSTLWINGKVLDPHNGRVYNAKITVAPDGQTLKMRGYIGIPLLGRTQIWHFISSDQLKSLLGKIHTKNPAGYFVTTTGKFVPPQYNSCKIMQQEVDTMTHQDQ